MPGQQFDPTRQQVVVLSPEEAREIREAAAAPDLAKEREQADSAESAHAECQATWRAEADAHRARADAAEADVVYWREQATGMAPSVDGMRVLCTRLFPGGTGCVVDPERVVTEVDSMLAAYDRLDTEAS